MNKSQRDDVFDMRVRSERTIKLYRVLLNNVWLIAVAVFGFFIGGAVASDIAHKHWGVVASALSGYALLSGVFYVVNCILLGGVADDFGWLPASQCGALADLLAENPGLHSYHHKVMAQGRRYANGEVDAMAWWVYSREAAAKVADSQAERDAQEQADCRRLYTQEIHTKLA